MEHHPDKLKYSCWKIEVKAFRLIEIKLIDILWTKKILAWLGDRTVHALLKTPVYSECCPAEGQFDVRAMRRH
jgi:hypothetical protein